MKMSPLVFALLLFFPLANADENDDLFDLSLDELANLKISAGTHFQLDWLDSPTNASVITREEARQKGARTLPEWLEGQAGIYTYPTLAGGNAIVIRGFATELSTRGLASSFDGVPLNNFVYGTASYGANNFDAILLDRMEVARGPGSAIYGNDAFHGAIALRSAEFDDKDEFNLDGADNSYGRIALRRHQGGDNPWLFAVAGSSQSNEGRNYHYQSVFDGEQESSRAYAHDGQNLLYKQQLNFTDSNFEYSLLYDAKNQRDYPGMGTHFFSGNWIQGAGDWSGLDSQMLLGNLLYKHSLSQHNSLSLQAYAWRNDYTLLFDNRNIETLPGLPPAHLVFAENQEQRAGAHLRLQHDSKKFGQLFVGLGHEKQAVLKSHLLRQGLDGNYIENSAAGYDGLQRSINSVYGEWQNKFWAERIGLNIGGRHDDYSDFGGHTSPRATLSYYLSKQQSLRLQYGHAYRAATAAEIAPTGLRVNASRDVKPETIDTSEFSYLHDSRFWRFQAAAFHSQWRDTIAFVANTTDPDIDGGYSNTGSSFARGVEITNQIFFGPWQAQWQFSRAYSKNLDTGLPHSTYPGFMQHFALAYQQGNYKFGSSLMHAFDWTDIKASGANPQPLPAYWRLDTYAQMPIPHGDAGLHIYNLSDRRQATPSLWDAHDGLPDKGRTLLLSLNWYL
ncbi:MAG: TonB-dependent receptor [Oceanospirillaceae bacterium]|nr:TonB-dependent receptor [Oceanospirillaceae bacterium]MCP5350386.1 TonB-dependent receptor [Oceanospirillaceae bacterium]